MALALGLSVSEVESFTAHELMEWAAFERDFGPLTIHERIDAGAATGAYATAVAFGGADRLNPEDLLPDWRASFQGRKTRPEQSDEQMMAFMRSLQARSKKRRKGKG